jgi:acyl carrier protein
MDIPTIIRQYISENLLFNDDYHYSDDDSFLEEGIIDSMGIMELVVFIQQEFTITVPDHEITPENFDTINRLAHFIDAKLHSSSP